MFVYNKGQAGEEAEMTMTVVQNHGQQGNLSEERLIAYETRENSCALEGIKANEVSKLVFTIKVVDKFLTISYGRKYRKIKTCITALRVDNWGYYGFFGLTARNHRAVNSKVHPTVDVRKIKIINTDDRYY